MPLVVIPRLFFPPISTKRRRTLPTVEAALKERAPLQFKTSGTTDWFLRNIRVKLRKRLRLPAEAVPHWNEFTIVPEFYLSVGGQKVFFVASANYRGHGPRFDMVEVSAKPAVDGEDGDDGAAEDSDVPMVDGDESEWAAEVFCFFSHPRHGCLAAVRYFRPIGVDEDCGVFVVERWPLRGVHTYDVVLVDSISCHAHLVPDFDGPREDGGPPTSSQFYYWDKVQDGRVDCIEQNPLRGESTLTWNARKHLISCTKLVAEGILRGDHIDVGELTNLAEELRKARVRATSNSVRQVERDAANAAYSQVSTKLRADQAARSRM